MNIRHHNGSTGTLEYFSQRIIWAAPFLMGFAALILYLYTLAPGVLWGDSAKLIQFVFERKLDIRPEYHPLHTLIGICFNKLPFGDLAYRVNFISAFFGALTVSVVYQAILKLTKTTLAAISGAGALTVSHVFWHLSVVAETYTVFTFLLALAILFLLRWDESGQKLYLYLSVFIAALSLSHNYLMPFLMPAFIYFYLSSGDPDKFKLKRGLGIGFYFMLGFSLWIVIAFISAKSGAGSLGDIIQGGAFKRYYRSFFKLIKELVLNPVYLFYQFPAAGFVIGLFGAYSQLRKDKRIFSFFLLLYLSDALFACGYMRQKQFFLLLPSYLVFAVWIGEGIARLVANRPKTEYLVGLSVTVILFPVVVYYSTPPILKVTGMDIVGARTLSYRDNSRFFLVPAKGNEDGAIRFAEEAFRIAGPDSIIIADFTPIAVLRYYQDVLGKRKDIWLKLVDFKPLDLNFVDTYIRNRDIYLADTLEPDYNIANLKQKYHILKKGPIYKLEPKKY